MLHYVDNDTTYLEQPRLINSKIGTPKMRVRADRANMSGNEDIYLSGNVRVVRYGEDETTMITSFLHVIPDNDIAKTNKPVTITQDNTIISAVGMEIDNNAQIIYLLSEVKFVHDKIR
jgi:lipopolysaccharide export system protein LptC